MLLQDFVSEFSKKRPCVLTRSYLQVVWLFKWYLWSILVFLVFRTYLLYFLTWNKKRCSRKILVHYSFFSWIVPEKFRNPRQKFVANGKLKIYVNFGAQLKVVARINTVYCSPISKCLTEKKKKKHGNDFKRLDSLSEFDISSFLERLSRRVLTVARYGRFSVQQASQPWLRLQ